jgi:autotransporter-associated beta strand protein
MSKKINSCFLRVSILFCLGSISSPAVAQNAALSTWTPTNTDFNNSANWSPNGALTTTNVAFFSAPASNSLSPQLTANSTIYGLNFTNSATGYTISTANNSVLTLSSAYNFVTNPIVRAPAIWAQNTSGTNRISAGLALAANTSTWFQAKGGTMEVTGNISESGASRKLSLASGVGTGPTSYYYLSGSNSYTGDTTINTGVLLTLGSANVLGTTAGATTINGMIDLNGYSITGEAITGGGAGSDAALGFLGNNSTTAASVTGSTLTLSSTSASGNSIGGTGNMTIGSAISGATNVMLNKVGTGEITLAGNNTYAGLTTVTSGTLTLSGSGTLGATSANLTIGGGTLNLGGLAVTKGAFVLDSGTLINGTLTASSYALTNAGTISAILAGSGALTKTGSGTATLSGNNTYAGLTTASAGTLTLSGDNSGASGGVSISGTAVLNINSANALGTGILITSSGSTINNTSGSAVINAGNNAVTLATTTTFGTTSSTSDNDLDLGTGTVTASGSPLINFAGNGTTLKMGTLNSTRTNIAASPTGATLTANNTGSGAGNTLVFDGFKLGSAALNNITVQINGNANVVFNGIIENSGSFANGIMINNTATTTFAGDNTYSGATTINSGALLKIGSATALGSTLTGTTVSAGGVLDMNGQAVGNEAISISTGTGGISGSGSLINSSANSASLSGAMTLLGDTTVGAGNITLMGNIGQSGGNRMLTKLGAGLLTLAGTNTYTGGTTISSGSLLVATNGSIASSSLSTVNGGSLTVNGTAGGVVVNTGGSLGGSGTVGALTLNSGGLLNPGNSPGTLTAASAIVLGGSTYNWQITSLTGTAGTNWDLFSVTGLLNMSDVSSSSRWNLVITGDSGFSGWNDNNSYSYVFAQAANVSGFSTLVGTDVTSLFNITTSGLSNLPNGSSVAGGDFKVVVGSSGGLTTLNLMTVPEPSTGVLFGFGFVGLICLRILRRGKRE